MAKIDRDIKITVAKIISKVYAPCETCDGHGFTTNEGPQVECKVCGGTGLGRIISIRVTDET